MKFVIREKNMIEGKRKVIMQFDRIFSLLIVLSMLGVWGCAAPAPKERVTTWVDMDSIVAEVKKSAPMETELDVTVAEKMVREKAAQKGKKPFSVRSGGENPYLAGIGKEKPKTAEAADGEGILLNFDNADIYEVIQSIAEILDINYVIDPKVKGVVNIRSGKKVALNQLFTLFRKILNINGLDIRSEGDYYYVYVAKKLTSQVVRGPGEIRGLSDSPRMIMQVVPIMYLAAAEAQKFLEPYLSEHGTIHNMPGLNMLIIFDFESKVIDCVTILVKIDISSLSSVKVSLVPVENAPLFDLTDELTEILNALKVNKKDYEGVSLIPLERVNALLLVSNNEFLLESVEAWIKDLDVVAAEGRDNIYIYNVRNSVATELADLVNVLITDEGGSTTSKPKVTLKDSKSKKTTPPPARKVTTKGPPKSTMQFVGAPMLHADDNRNIILIRALAPDYSRLVKLLERLDNMPRQVLIEVVVAEVVLTDDWSFGVEWWVKNHGLEINQADYTDNFISDFTQLKDPGNVMPGFTYSLLSANGNVFALLNALASNSDVSILSSPQVMVLNNETAKVNVGAEVPIVTTETVSDDSSTDTVDRTIQYKDTGVILEVTPKINFNGVIILDIDQQITEAKKHIVSGIDSAQISKRQVTTKLAVKDGQTILLGGMISQKTTMVEAGIPFLKDAPVLGWFFKYQEEKLAKTELLIMITPHVIETEDVLDQYAREFRKKVLEVKGELLD